MSLNGKTRQKMRQIATSAGVAPWKDAFQTLRRSREIEWAQSYPQYAVSMWIGHSIQVSGKHYATIIPDELFDSVACSNEGNQDVSGVVQNAVQNPSEMVGNAVKSQEPENVVENEKRPKTLQNKGFPGDFNSSEEWSRRESNPRAVTVNVSRLHVYSMI